MRLFYIPKKITEKINDNNQHNNQQQKTRKGDVTVASEIEVAIKALDHHIEKLEAKLSFLIRSYDDDPSTTLLLYQYEKKIATVRQEIEYAIEDRRRLNNLSQMGIISALR
ncbi:MAG TPA: hypothetical protein VE572_05335 [Nitrososphaeraceae archaeon]|nr:hypothetical protein [Nitrososphaeraceae archaeon]